MMQTAMRDAFPLPTFSLLGINETPQTTDAVQVATVWLDSFSKALSANDTKAAVDLFIPTCYWRDLLSFTWNFRTLDGHERIKKMLDQRLALTKPTSFKIKKDGTTGLQNVAPDLVWLQSSFIFDTDVGRCSGILRLVPWPNGTWKCHCLLTNLDGLRGFPEKLGHHRDPLPNHGKWLSARQEELEFRNQDPAVLIIGGGHSGLSVAARLKVLGVQSLVIEKNARIGDTWRKRYQCLCLHDPVWYDHLPYLPFPLTWPVFTPAHKFANWLENYAEALELNVWLSSEVTSAAQDASGKWKVTVTRGGIERIFLVNHVICASGLNGGTFSIPEYAGMDKFKGQVLHSMQHTQAADHAGKKVVVVGACVSAHDVAADYANNGIDVTMYQRSSTYVMSAVKGWQILMQGLYGEDAPPTDVADRINASFPNMMSVPLAQGSTKAIAEIDKELLEGLNRVGFKTNMGINGTGAPLLHAQRAGGYYPDVGASQYIIDGKIKMKSDSLISTFTETGLEFEDGSKLDADVILFATGTGQPRDFIRKICGDNIADNLKPILGLDEEGEVRGTYRDVGFPGLWVVSGGLGIVRFWSMRLALQIKAMEEGLFTTRYTS